MHEAALVKKMMMHLERNVGGLWIKISAGPFQASGLPDIIGCYKGRFYGIEVKVPGKEHELRPLQKYWIKRITDAGGKATMLTTVEEADRFVRGK